MNFPKTSRPALSLGVSLLLAACALPSATPMRTAFLESETYPVITPDRTLAKTITRRDAARFSKEFTQAGAVDVDSIRPGDQLQFQIFENVDTGLLGAVGRAPSLIGPIEVSGSGMISLPYAGSLRASGRTLAQLRADLIERLAQQTPDPQVIVTRMPSPGFSVTVSGNATVGGVVPLNYGQRRLRAALAATGGVAGDPALVHVVVSRQGKRGRARLDQIQSVSGQDIALLPGDSITVETAQPKVAVLGSTSSQGTITLERLDETLVGALSRAGGLSLSSADARGLFVLRTAETAAADPTVFAFDMTKPEGLFAAEAFGLRDGDVVYVSEVGISRTGRALRALLGFVQPVDQLSSIGN